MRMGRTVGLLQDKNLPTVGKAAPSNRLRPIRRLSPVLVVCEPVALAGRAKSVEVRFLGWTPVPTMACLRKVALAVRKVRKDRVALGRGGSTPPGRSLEVQVSPR